jgi:hypothetical protein
MQIYAEIMPKVMLKEKIKMFKSKIACLKLVSILCRTYPLMLFKEVTERILITKI